MALSDKCHTHSHTAKDVTPQRTNTVRKEKEKERQFLCLFISYFEAPNRAYKEKSGKNGILLKLLYPDSG